MNVMPLERIPDYEMRIKRQDAFWDREILDRPAVCIMAPKPAEQQVPWPKKSFKTIRDRWMDAEAFADWVIACVHNQDYYGDALPHGDPNLGPEVFSAFFGTELEYGETTSWSVPNLLDWKNADKLQFSEDNFYWKKINEITDVLLEKGRGKFYTGITDLHPGGDAIVAFRDPLRMNFDMLDNPDEIKRLLRRVTDVYKKVYSFYVDKLIAGHQPVTAWPDIVSSKRWYVPSNDFSCMVSKEMFDEFFLPGIQEECRMCDASIYHLDGPNAVQHLDSLLQIRELNAIQWVYGAGNGRASDWMHLYKKIQAAGKGIQLTLEANELDYFMQELRPNGVWLKLWAGSKEEAEALLQKISTWC